jgi:hypothetical protein
MKNASRSVLFALLITPALHAGGFSDDFSKPNSENRQALRGAWTFEQNVAHCVADPELYKKHQNHGPILRWAHAFTNGEIDFEIMPVDCQRLVFTLNDKGHVFRFSLSDAKRSRIFGWATQSSKENKPETLAQEGVPTLEALNQQWTKVHLAIKGDESDIRIGDYSAKLTHACLARSKGEVTISFAEGELSIRKVNVKSDT